MQKLKLTKKYEKYPEYKDSGVEWIGKIPKEWSVATSRRLFITKKDRVGSDFGNYKILSLTLNGVIPRVLDGSGKNPAEYDTYQVFNKNDLVFCLFDYDVTPRTIGYVEENGMMTGAYTRLIPQKETFSRYYYYYFLSLDFSKELLHLCTGLRNSLSKPVFWSLLNPFPSADTQEKISDYLDHKISSIDQIIEKKQKMIELLKEKRTAVINHAVTRGLNPRAELVDSGVEWIGKIPKEWSMRKVFHLFNTIGSGTTPDDKYLTDSNSGTPWVNTGDLTDSYIELPTKKVRPEALSECSALKLFSKNAVVIAMYGATIGKLGMPQFDFCTNQACCVLEGPSNFVSSKFVYYWLLGNKKYIIEMGVGGGQPNINKEIVKSLKVSLPPKDIQDDIVAYLNIKVNNFDVAIRSVQNSVEILKDFKSSFVSNVVTGKIKI